jgi:tRNA nucleotidyltransferase/poly(A) polymerase
MPDYIYLLEKRLSADQQHAVRQLREAAREAGMILFLTGDAVRDLTSGHAVRDLEVAVHGNALKLKKAIAKLGGKAWGEDETSRSLYLCFPGTVRVDLISTHRTEYLKPGKPVFHPASIHEDLRRRDFTVNAMAISLNEGSFGLLMDPLNGAADIEARTLRLVSNYGFLENPALLIRATRYMAQLGWELDPKTLARYENAKSEGAIEYLAAEARSRELEQIGHEEDGLKVLRALEAEGWMKALFPAWTQAKADEEKLKALHDLAVELLLQGVHPDMSAAQMQLLTAKLAARELTALKKLMLRPGFVQEWNSLDSLAAGFAKVLLAKGNATPSASFKLFTSYDPEAILWLGFTSKDAAVRERYELFLKVWPEARQRIPHALLQEMRITPELAAYREIVKAVFLELIDGRLTAPEEFRAFLEPHSPPAPPPQVTIKKPRAKRVAEAKLKERTYDRDEAEDGLDEGADLDDLGGDEDEIGLGLSLPKVELDSEIAEESEPAENELEAEVPEPVPVPVKRASKAPRESKPAKETPAPAPVKAEKPAAAVPAAKPIAPKPEKAEKPQPVSKPAPAPKPVPALKAESKPVPQAKSAPAAAKPQASSAKAKPVPAPAPAKAKPAPAVKKTAPAPVASKGSKAAKVAAVPPAAKAVAQVPVKSRAKAPVKAAVKVQAKAPVKVQAKTAVKASPKPPVKAPAKPPVKAPAKASAKPQVKVTAKAPAKASAVKSAPAKGKPAPAAASKAGKVSHAVKPSKPAVKKPAPKPAKKRQA